MLHLRQPGRRKKSKRLAPRIQNGWQKKANDYPAIINAFSTELCRFLCFSA
ncbi:hypothetical protein A676_00670 [Salmonella enterica subsp. enterica serovar Enteritidis str. 2010K-0262]|nr:hypothetical protein A671_03366 [Salmonella enterica subsp. enterica serovar Dublin str. DG22]EPI76002.1 hypothetical protein A672_01041 [Salmonella enterica subsp. enterica serovar Enteritidis str. 08-1080]EPI85303.1 hypothetical protein A675_02563 [Salmonella enterica subsp. enterica serovar Enteritidis str. 2009K1726]EPI89838.1 hypothetical protein A676_00670 [Salmonella enterica subsp. enterica serovar Enteritidis str. 2010K-0262]EPJ04908.1 hypothetical protein A678_01343 [Salmonella ent